MTVFTARGERFLQEGMEHSTGGKRKHFPATIVNYLRRENCFEEAMSDPRIKQGKRERNTF
jgi:hypothetical protein